jgi:hypothetical protein
MRTILFILGGYILFKLIRSLWIPNSQEQKIDSKSPVKNSEYKNLNISDAEFEDINEENKHE